MNRYICFVGDLFAGGTLLQDDPRNLVRSSTYRNADLRIANLEHPIGTGEPMPRKSTVHAPPEALEHLTKLNVDAVSLANNHVHDLGPEGIGETVDLLESAGIDSFGAGRTLQEASEPYWVSEELVIQGYCAFDSPSLNKIQVATDVSPGVNPLTRENIEKDLQQLDSDTKAILFVHWGIENAWLPSSEELDLADELLDHPRVAGIVGAHPHRVQGYTSRGSKRAYYSLGNFLIPDFHLEPPVSVTYPSLGTRSQYETKRYHPVTELTKKTWTIGARISLLVSYDLEAQEFAHTPLYQGNDPLSVHELTGRLEKLVRCWISLSKRIADGTGLLNRIALSANRSAYKLWNLLGILAFLYRQNGAKWMLDFLRVAFESKLKPGIDANECLYEFFED